MNNPYQSPSIAIESAEIESAEIDKPLTRGAVRLLRAVVWLYPVILIAAFYATWLVAWFVLGHMPRPSLDDPKSISMLVDVFYTLAGLILVGFPAAAIVGTVTLLSIPRHSWVRRGLSFSLYSAIWVFAISFLSWDPLRVGEWFFD